MMYGAAIDPTLAATELEPTALLRIWVGNNSEQTMYPTSNAADTNNFPIMADAMDSPVLTVTIMEIT